MSSAPSRVDDVVASRLDQIGKPLPVQSMAGVVVPVTARLPRQAVGGERGADLVGAAAAELDDAVAARSR